MSLKIIVIHNHGDAKEEYIVFQAKSDIDLGSYAIVDRTFNKDGALSNVHRHFFRFPTKLIKNGDYVSLHTGVGKPSSIKTKNDDTVHHFFWGSKSPIWNDNDTEQAELLKVATIEYKDAPKEATKSTAKK
jgi:hypothetical protein